MLPPRSASRPPPRRVRPPRIAWWSSDATIARALAEGRIEIDPYDEALLQPSSVDVRVDRFFRVFHNNRYPFIDVKVEQEELTELVEVDGDHPFVLHPGEFVLGSTLERVRLSNDLVARLEGKSSLGRLGLLDPLHRGLHRSRLGRARDARALERREPPDHDLPGHEDRADLLHADDRARDDAVRLRRRSGRSTRARRARRPAATGRTSSDRSRHRPRRLHRANTSSTRCGRGRSRCGRSCATAAALHGSPPGARSSSRATSPTPDSVRAAIAGADAVIHLVSIIKGSRADFERVMAQGTRDLVAAAEEAGVRRFVLASALGLNEHSKDRVPYFAAKWEMEHAVKESAVEHVIFRPSFVFGRDGGALPTFVRLARFAPVTPIVGPGTQRLQPIWVEDVAEYCARRARPAGRGGAHVRHRRPGCAHLERVLGPSEARARHAAAVGPRALQPDARCRRRSRSVSRARR